MHRRVWSIAIVLGAGLPVLGQTPEVQQRARERLGTVKYLQELQAPDGGFAPVPQDSRVDQVPRGSLRATSSALRALKYFGGAPKDKAAAAKFVRSCYDENTGAFGDQPGGKPDIFSTAVGLMAAVEAGLPLRDYADKCAAFLATAKEFEDVRIAAAGFETAKALPPIAEAWRRDLAAKAAPDGNFGQGAGKARLTGSVVVTILRLGGKINDPAAVLAVLHAGQNADGGFGKDDSGQSDLESTYRILRCYHMLGAKPANVDALRGFIAKCRSEDGGYSVKPGQASNVGGTYFAGIVLHWLDAR